MAFGFGREGDVNDYHSQCSVRLKLQGAGAVFPVEITAGIRSGCHADAGPGDLVRVSTDEDVGVVTVNMQYALITEHGESHWPKDNDRREIAFDQQTVAAVNEQVLSEVQALADASRPLSPGWWRQLGREQKAQKVEFNLLPKTVFTTFRK